jgi:hypothetical protein
VTNAVAHLRGLAERSAAAYLAETEPQAILLVGSGATGDADAYSDIDLLLYYDDLPTEPRSKRRGAVLERSTRGSGDVTKPVSASGTTSTASSINLPTSDGRASPVPGPDPGPRRR